MPSKVYFMDDRYSGLTSSLPAKAQQLFDHAGLAKERDAEIEKYKAFDDKTLDLLKGDVEVFIAEKQKFVKLAGPKAKFTAEQKDQVKAKMEEIRTRYFGHKGTPGTPTSGAD